MSGGIESVVVQWNLDTQDKNFVSRLGNGEIQSIGIHDQFYSVIFGNNSFKIFRQENNKVVIESAGLDLSSNSVDDVDQINSDGTLAFVKDSKI